MAGKDFWFVLYTKPRQEKKAKEQLDKLSIQNYLATVTKRKKWCDRDKKVDEVLLTSYIFIKGSEKERLMALDLSSIVRCVYDRGRPAIVPDWQIQNLKNFLSKVENVSILDENLRGKKIIIKEGPFAGIIGTINKRLNGNYLSVSLDFVNRSVSTIVTEDAVKLIEVFSEDFDEKKFVENKLSEKFLSV
jgi:transcription antitermination factor NusG